jgi:hypothetical protein
MLMKVKYLCLITLLVFSCRSYEQAIYEFDPRDNIRQKVTLAEIVDTISYIPLDNSIPIGMYYQYTVVNNLLYLSVKDIGILVFNRNGKILGKIGNTGRGPGEYLFFMNFAVDEENGNIYVMDYNIIKTYSGSGKYIRSIPLWETGGYFQEVNYFNSKLFIPEYILTGKATYNWIIMDTLGSILSRKRNYIPEFSSTFLFKGGTYKFDNTISYWNLYNDTVFTICPDLTYKASLLFSKGDHRHPRYRIEDYSTLADVFHPHLVFETDCYYTISFYYKKSTIVFIDKKNGNTFVSYPDQGTGGIVNNIDGGMGFSPTGYFSEKHREYITNLISAHSLKTFIQTPEFRKSIPKYPEKKKELEKLADSLKETANPILMIVRLKK